MKKGIAIFGLVFVFGILPSSVYAHCAGKHTGNHPHCASGGDEYSANAGVVFITPSDVGNFDYHIIGTEERDDIRAGSGADLIEGNGTRDEIFGLGNDDEIHGGDGSDVIDAGDGDDNVFGGAGGDWLAGKSGTDAIYGEAGDDHLEFSLGQDLYDGGSGFDAMDFRQADSVSVDLDLSSYDASSGASVETGSFISIEAVWGSPGNDVISGSAVSDTFLYGDEGNDLIYGLAGNDGNIDGGPGEDELYGGLGDDFLDGSGDSDLMFGGEGNDTLKSRGDESSDEMHGGLDCDIFVFTRRFGSDFVMDFQDGCDLIDLSWYNPKYRADFGDLRISSSGDDVTIDFWFTKQGGVGGTIILKDAVADGVVADASDFVF